MKLINKQVVCILLIFISLAQSAEIPIAWCEQNKDYENTRIFTALKDQQFFSLDKYFKGYALEFSLNDDANQQTYQLRQVEEYRNQSITSDKKKKPIGFDHIFENYNMEGKYAELFYSDEDSKYIVEFGDAGKQVAPSVKDKVLIDSIDIFTEHIRCLDIVLLRYDVAIVDCVQFVGATSEHWYNVYIMITGKDKERVQAVYTSSKNYLNFRPLGRKTIKYDTSTDKYNQLYLVQGVPVDLQDEFETEVSKKFEQSYLNIFRYVYDDTDENGITKGRLQANAPLVASDLGFNKQYLELADFDTLGDWIYVLDRDAGVSFIQYKYNKVAHKRVFNLSSFGKVNRYGIHANYLGNSIQLLIAEKFEVVEYIIHNMDVDTPQFVNSYTTDAEIVGTVKIESTQRYVALGQGRMVTVYQRGHKDGDYVVARIPDAQLFSLFFSDNLQVSLEDQIVNYDIVEPQLRVNPTRDDQIHDSTLTITAVSKYFHSQRQECKIDLISRIIDKRNTQEIFQTGYKHDFEWKTQDSTAARVPLDSYYIGPNISYTETLEEEQENIPIRRNLRSDSKEPENRYRADDKLIIDEPKEINVNINYDEGEEWTFSRVITIEESGNFYQVHQNKEFEVVIYHCSESNVFITEVMCGKPIAVIKNKDKVKDMTYGTYGGIEDILAVVYEDSSYEVKFYYMHHSSLKNDSKPGKLWFIETFSTFKEPVNHIKAINLLNNNFYVIIEGSKSKVIVTNLVDDLLEIRLVITEKEFSTWHNGAQDWDPERVYVSPYHPGIMFILNQKMIYVVDISENQPYLLSYLAIEVKKNIGVFVTKKSLIYSQADNVIKDYLINNLSEISHSKEFNFPLYQYQFIDRFTVAAGYHSGLIYVLAQTIGQKDLNLMIFRSSEVSINTLLKVIKLEDNITLESNKAVTLTAGGSEDDFVFVQYNGKRRFFRVPTENQIIIIPRGEDIKQYVDYVDIKVDVQPWSGAKAHTIEHTVTLVNNQLDPEFHEKFIEKGLPEHGFYTDGSDSKTFELNTQGWWTGSVLELEAQCQPNPEVCQNQISIKQQVSESEKSEEKLSNIHGIVDMVEDLGVVYYLYLDASDINDIKYRVGQIDTDLSVKEEYNTLQHDRTNSIQCMHLIPVIDPLTENLEHFYVICQDFGISEYFVEVIYKKGSADDGSIKPAYFKNLPSNSVSQSQYQAFHGYLFINAQTGQKTGGIYIYDVYGKQVTFLDKQYVEEIQTIDTTYFSSLSQYSQITSFFVTYNKLTLTSKEEKFIKLIIADSPTVKAEPPKIYFLNLELEKKLAPREPVQECDMINFRDFISNHKLFINQDTTIVKFEHVGPPQQRPSGSNIFMSYKFIVMTSNTAMYELKTVFQSSSEGTSLPMELVPDECEISNIYNNYGTWKPYPYMKHKDGVLFVGYFNEKQQRTILAVYDMNIEGIFQHEVNYIHTKGDAYVPLHAISGGYTYPNKSVQLLMGEDVFPVFAFAPYLKDGQRYPSILTSNFDGKYGIREFDYTRHHITLETKGDFKDQQLVLWGKSSYGQKTSMALSNTLSHGSWVDPNKPGDNGNNGTDDDDTSYGWVIAISIIAGLLILGGVGFWFWKKKKAQANGFVSMTEKNSDLGYSLQEPGKA